MDPTGPDRAVLLELAERLRRAEPVVLATAVATHGSPPCRAGQRLLVGPSGPLAGTLGCSEFDASATADAPRLLAGGAGSERRRYRHDLGEVDVLLEPFPAPRRLLVLGATPVAAHLLRWAPALGYHTVLVEPRPERVTGDLASLAGRVVGRPEDAGPGPGCDAVHTDHDAPLVAEHLAAVIRAGADFVGVMGSSRHTAAHRDAMRAAGLSDAELARLRTPVGLDIGAATTEEIALSILAGLVAARRDRPGGWLDRR